MLFDQIWLGSYMSGGVGFTQYATAAYTDNILDDYMLLRSGLHQEEPRWPRQGKGRPRKSSTTSQPRSPSTVWSSTSSTRLPSRATSAVPSVQPSLQQHPVSPAALATANSNAGLNGWYMSMLTAQGRLVTSRLLRLRPAGPVRFRKLNVHPARRGLYRRAPWTKLPQLCNERRSPGRIRSNRRLPPTMDAGCMDPVPADEDHVSQTRRSSSTSPNPAASSQRVQSASSCPPASAH